MEEWIDIIGYEGLYRISNYGRVMSFKRQGANERILVNNVNTKGYEFVCLSKNDIIKSFKVHRLVASHFISNPYNLETVNHMDKDKTNNRVENLEWMTNLDNNVHGKGMKVLQYMDGVLLNEYGSTGEAGRYNNINQSNICQVCLGKRKSAGGYNWTYKNTG